MGSCVVDPISRYGFVYMIENLANGKRYVGKTVMTLKCRWYAHVNQSKRATDTMILHAAIRKYGTINFRMTVLCRARAELLGSLEMFFIRLLGTRIEHGFGYNMTDGGEGMHGRIPTAETRAKMSAALIGNRRGATRQITDEFRRKCSEANAGRKKSPTHIEAMRSRRLGVAPPRHVVERAREANWTTHCKHGHLRTEFNTYVHIGKDGQRHRSCRECRLKVNREMVGAF